MEANLNDISGSRNLMNFPGMSTEKSDDTPLTASKKSGDHQNYPAPLELKKQTFDKQMQGFFMFFSAQLKTSWLWVPIPRDPITC